MKFKFLISILLCTFALNINSQSDDSRFTFGDWKIFKGDNGIYLYTGSEGVENFSSENLPDFTVRIALDDKGTIYIRLDSAFLYRYEKGVDFVDVDLIIDDGDIISYGGRVTEIDNVYKTRVLFERLDDSPQYLDLFGDLKNGNNLYVRTTGGGKPKVYKFSLNGFSQTYDKLFELWGDIKNENPFKKKENPFNR